MVGLHWMLGSLLVVITIGCAGDDRSAVATRSPTQPPTVVRSPSPVRMTPTTTPSSTASPTTELLDWDVRASRLIIPALDIDSAVTGSQTVPVTSTPPLGCPAPPPGRETLTVPNEGIATPEEAFEGLENKSWIFGHSRWQNVPGVFHALEDIAIGDELLLDGTDRKTGARVDRLRFVVEGIYLTDKESGAELITADGPAEIPDRPTVILQTSVRESGANKQWLLDREWVLSRATNLVGADLEDPCRYLLLFVIARAEP